jgi:hypothetical protein
MEAEQIIPNGIGYEVEENALASRADTSLGIFKIGWQIGLALENVDIGARLRGAIGSEPR